MTDTPIVAVSPVVDLYGLADRLLSLVVDGFSSRSVTLPKVQYVSGGQLPAYDGEQITVNLNQINDGRAGGGAPQSTDMFFMEQYVDLTVAIVRDYPVDVTGPTTASKFNAVKVATRKNMVDVATLHAVLRDIRAQQLLVDDNVPFLIPFVRTEGPEGGVVAAVGTISLSQFVAPHGW